MFRRMHFFFFFFRLFAGGADAMGLGESVCAYLTQKSENMARRVFTTTTEHVNDYTVCLHFTSEDRFRALFFSTQKTTTRHLCIQLFLSS